MTTLTAAIAISIALVGSGVHGQPIPKMAVSAATFIPPGYVVEHSLHGDLNGDSRADHVFIIKGTDKAKLFNDEYRGTVDRNRRGIIVVLGRSDGDELVVANLACFSSANESGGVYFPPELMVTISKGSLLVHYAHGRYGYWTYNFRYQNSDVELIGYESSEDRGPTVERTTSINFGSKKMRIRKNLNPASDSGGEKMKETWQNFVLSKPIKLRDIADFDELSVEGLVGRRD
jgi:hypothetical protein